jgi:hypothetical protein
MASNARSTAPEIPRTVLASVTSKEMRCPTPDVIDYNGSDDYRSAGTEAGDLLQHRPQASMEPTEPE